MVDVSKLQKGNLLEVLKNDTSNRLVIGDIVKVVEVGYSRWDSQHYADCKTEKGYIIEIMDNFRDFKLI
jgi:hypothetical protein